MNMRQLPLSLEPRRMFGRADFLVSECNYEAAGWIDAWPEWGDIPGIIAVGEAQSGKTHSAYLFSEKSGAKIYNASELSGAFFGDIVPIESAVAIDDIDEAAGNAELEEILFHIINYAAEAGTKLFMTSARPAKGIGFSYPDLATRAGAFPTANIYAPDDGFLKALLVKQLMERGIGAEENVVEYVAKTAPRTPAAIAKFADMADKSARRLTIPAARGIIMEIIAEMA
jgi:chromosomal replication initiation ATPase DnaA